MSENSTRRPSGDNADSVEQTIRQNLADAGGIDALTADLLALSARVEPDMTDPGCDEPTIDCRLRWHDGSFSFVTGDSSYDQDHRGHWGASCVGADENNESARAIALGLLDQVLDSACQSV